MASIILFLLVLISAKVCFISACLEDEYDSQQANFQEWCDKYYDGFANGNRCFFPGNPIAGYETIWPDAWKVCRSRGGTLAPVLTSSEMKMLSTTFLAKYGDMWMWTAMQRTVAVRYDPGPPGPLCSYARNTTYVFDNENLNGRNLSLMNTWMRNRQCSDDAGQDNGQCIHLWASQKNIGDLVCKSDRIRALCTVSKPVQPYRRVDGVCVTETPLAVNPTTDPEDCMQQCRLDDWCRSVNYKGDKCELFSWWINDNPNVATQPVQQNPCGNATTTTPTCVHYTYVPNI